MNAACQFFRVKVECHSDAPIKGPYVEAGA